MEEAYRCKWILSNSQVLALLELKQLPSTVSFQRHGFVFKSDRQQQEQQKGWRVLKVDTVPIKPSENHKAKTIEISFFFRTKQTLVLLVHQRVVQKLTNIRM